MIFETQKLSWYRRISAVFFTLLFVCLVIGGATWAGIIFNRWTSDPRNKPEATSTDYYWAKVVLAPREDHVIPYCEALRLPTQKAMMDGRLTLEEAKELRGLAVKLDDAYSFADNKNEALAAAGLRQRVRAPECPDGKSLAFSD